MINIRIHKTYNEDDIDRFDTFWADEDASLAGEEFRKDSWPIAFPIIHMEIFDITAQDDREVVGGNRSSNPYWSVQIVGN